MEEENMRKYIRERRRNGRPRTRTGDRLRTGSLPDASAWRHSAASKESMSRASSRRPRGGPEMTLKQPRGCLERPVVAQNAPR
eukprot:6111956-Pyramimonas_sp.AAC.2